ncbi:anti-sigma-I factor RsgI8 isoform X8 [Dicentrarchus labrax]|uniref:anti-sigma-I factor RsgI8 isoform X8 n=1 Tax=Dicentrarchus labrax TaxID=13489 RepID=UPI0021F68DB0|nr:anti-sigma-I factor RsgI8 isoform X8 [Dicentrarchus labrax]
MNREKMICWILLLINLTSCVCGTFVVNVTQTSYQAEENHNITLEWTFTTNTHSSLNSLYIYCRLITDYKISVLYDLDKGVEVSESQDEQFKGRVQCDKDVLREGRIRLHVSRLRTEDSGRYLCNVRTNYGASSERCQLRVTAADEPKPQRPPESPQAESPQAESPQPESPQPESPQPESPQPESPQPESPQPESPGIIILYVVLGLAVAVLLAVCCCYFRRNEKQPIWTNR